MALSESQFETMFQEELDGNYERALRVFNQFGKPFSVSLINLLFQADGEKEKVEKIISRLEIYWEKNPQLHGIEALEIEERAPIVRRVSEDFKPENFLSLPP